MKLALALLATFSTSACGGGAGGPDAAPPADAPPNEGSLSLSWEVTNGADAIDCSEVGAITVGISAIEEDAFSGVSDAFNCTSGSATSRGLPVGTYDVEIDLRAAGSRSLLEAPIEMNGVEVTMGQSTDLGMQTFEVNPSGSLTFTLEADAAGTNCGTDTGAGDAAIIEMVLELEDDSGACVPTTFDIDGMPSFTNDCGGTAVIDGCIEAGTAVSVESTDSGPHALRLIGRRDDPEAEMNVDCFTGLSQFTVLGNDLEVDLGALQLPRNTNDDACLDQ